MKQVAWHGGAMLFVFILEPESSYGFLSFMGFIINHSENEILKKERVLGLVSFVPCPSVDRL